MSYDSIPFTMRVSDYSRLEGLLHFLEDAPDIGLKLEFYHKESVLNVFGSGLREASISISQIRSLEHKRGWFGDKLVICCRSLGDAKAIPGSKQGRVILKVKKAERAVLQALVVDVDLALAQHRLDELESR